MQVVHQRTFPDSVINIFIETTKEKVYLLNSGNVGNRKLLQAALYFLIISSGSLVNDLLLPSGGSLKSERLE